MKRQGIELVREGRFAADVAIELDYSEEPWSPTMSLDDAKKLERVRRALRTGDFDAAAREAKVYELLPLAG